MLNKSYRMPKSVSQFVREYIYENQLEDHTKALRDTKEREAARRVCKNIYTGLMVLMEAARSTG